MRTDDLVSMLARDAEPVPGHHARQKLLGALTAGSLVSTLLMVTVLGVRPDLGHAAQLSMFWVKIGFPAALSVATVYAYWRLSHPGMRLKAAPAGMAVPVLAMTLLAAIALFAAAPEDRAALLFGTTWRSCPFNIAFLSLPVFIALGWLMKSLAPTRPRLAGAACGLLSGAIAAIVYALHCPELAAPFIAVWYVLGMLIPAATGAAFGARLLRW